MELGNKSNNKSNESQKSKDCYKTNENTENNESNERNERNENIVITALMCHAPIVIPAIGRRQSSQCQLTTSSMQKVAREIVSSEAEGVFVISPHTPRFEDVFGVVENPHLNADFRLFGNPDIRMDFRNDLDMVLELTEKNKSKYNNLFQKLSLDQMDHGASVPLYFLAEMGWNRPVVVLSLPLCYTQEPDPVLNKKCAKFLSLALHQSHKKWAVIASGDMSHRLTPSAPAGYDPQAKDFDEWIVEAVENGHYSKACEVSLELRQRAAEDIVDSLEIASNLMIPSQASKNFEFLSYEGPFGVGYLVALLNRVRR